MGKGWVPASAGDERVEKLVSSSASFTGSKTGVNALMTLNPSYEASRSHTHLAQANKRWSS
jgi:hypothetical protein